MAIFSIVMSIVFTAMIAVQRQTGQVEEQRRVGHTQVRSGLAQIDKQVRSGNVLYSPADEPAGVPSCTASGNGRHLHAGVHPDPRSPALRPVAGDRRSIPPGDEHAPQPGLGVHLDHGRQRVAVGHSGARARPSPSVMPFTLQGGATAYKSRLLDVRLEAIDKRRPGKPTVISSSLAGRNTNYGYYTGLCSPVPPA